VPWQLRIQLRQQRDLRCRHADEQRTLSHAQHDHALAHAERGHAEHLHTLMATADGELPLALQHIDHRPRADGQQGEQQQLAAEAAEATDATRATGGCRLRGRGLRPHAAGHGPQRCRSTHQRRVGQDPHRSARAASKDKSFHVRSASAGLDKETPKRPCLQR
jgi:hypothetical protein